MTEKRKTYIVQNDIVCRNAIGRDKEQCLVIDLEDFANLTGSDLLDVVLAEINLGDSCVGSHDVWFVDLYFLCLLVLSCLVLRCGGSCDSSWLVTGVLIFLRAKSENLRHWQGLSRAPGDIQCCTCLYPSRINRAQPTDRSNLSIQTKDIIRIKFRLGPFVQKVEKLRGSYIFSCACTMLLIVRLET